eukprot:g4763.t1
MCRHEALQTNQSGEPPGLDQARYGVAEAGSRDTRYPQIFDPEARTVTTLTRRDSAFRGYHNTAGLLKDGSILLGGGFEYHGDVGCENPTLRRLYPGYLSAAKGKRPVVTKVTAGGKVVMGGQQRGEPSAEVTPSKQGETALSIEYTGPKLHPTHGAALLAAQAFTHSYGQNQRYVPLRVAAGGSDKPGVVQVFLPKVPVVLPGQYFLFLVSEQGKPSVGVHFHVGLAARGKGRGAPKSPGNKGKATTPLQPGSAAAMGGGGSRAGSGVGNGDGSPSMHRFPVNGGPNQKRLALADCIRQPAAFFKNPARLLDLGLHRCELHWTDDTIKYLVSKLAVGIS